MGLSATQFDICAFGARSGGDATENARAIAAANDAAAIVRGGWLYIPGGNYRVDSGIEYKVPIRGEGGHIMTSVIEGTWKDGKPWLSIKDVRKWVSLKDFAIVGPATSEQSIVGIEAINSHRYLVSDVHIRLCACPVRWAGWIGTWENCHFHFNHTGPILSLANGVSFLGGVSEGNTLEGLTWESGNGGGLFGMTIEGNGGAQLLIKKCGCLSIDGCYLERINSGPMIHIGAGGSASTDCANVTLRNCHMPGNTKLTLENCEDVTLDNCRMIGYVEVGQNARQISSISSGPKSDDYLGNSRWRVHAQAERDVFKRCNGRRLPFASETPKGPVDVSEETALINPWRLPARRLTAKGTQPSWYLQFDITPEATKYAIGSALYGGAWVYVPSGQRWVGDNSGAKITSKLVIIVAGKETATESGTNMLTLDRWNWCNARRLDIPDNVQSVQLRVGVFGTTGAKPIAGDYLIVAGPVVATPDMASRHELPFMWN